MEENKPNEIPVLAQTPAQPPPTPSPLKEIKPKGPGLKSKWLFLIILLLLVLILPLGGYFILNQTKNTPSPSPTPDQKACSQEAKICPDGSSVGRTGPQCEFSKCPETTASPSVETSVDTSSWKTFDGINVIFKYPDSWNPAKQQDLLEGTLNEFIKLGIPNTVDNNLIISKEVIANEKPKDAVLETDFVIAGQAGKKYLRKSVDYFAYDYYTFGLNNKGQFGIHVSLRSENKELEKQLDEMVKSITFK